MVTPAAPRLSPQVAVRFPIHPQINNIELAYSIIAIYNSYNEQSFPQLLEEQLERHVDKVLLGGRHLFDSRAKDPPRPDLIEKPPEN